MERANPKKPGERNDSRMPSGNPPPRHPFALHVVFGRSTRRACGRAHSDFRENRVLRTSASRSAPGATRDRDAISQLRLMLGAVDLWLPPRTAGPLSAMCAPRGVEVISAGTTPTPGQNDMAYYNQTLKALHRRPEAKPDLRERLKSRRQRRQRRSSGANS